MTLHDETLNQSPTLDAVIVGAGFAGIAMAHALKRDGCDTFVILERSDAVGGTWRDNRYPGAACDVESFLYSFSFATNPSWKHLFGRQDEILSYTLHCVESLGLRPHIETNSEVISARFDTVAEIWRVATRDGRYFCARNLIAACGGLSNPVRPHISGADQFEGDSFHTAEWPETYETAGKRVGVIGTGASAIQVVPAVARDAAKLTVFQRTPPWILPRHDREIGSAEQALYRKLPSVQRLYRLFQYVRHESYVFGFAVEPRIMGYVERFALRHIREQIADPALRARVTPDYRIGCKRILLSNDYYPALQQPNVAVVNSAIAQVEALGVRTHDGVLHELDTLVWATGFQAAETAPPFELVGPSGRRLDEAWTPHPVAYNGTCVAGFPNLYILVGPNTGLGHSSMLLMIEAQVQFVMSCLALARSKGAAIAVRAEAQREYNTMLQARLAKTVWASGCASWYQTGAGVNTTLWPGFTFEFMWRLRKVEARHFETLSSV